MPDPRPPRAPGLLVRPATARDIPSLLRHRLGMFRDMNHRDEGRLAAVARSTRAYLRRALADGSFRAWLAVAGRRVVGGGGVVLTEWPSHPGDLRTTRATILNVYTEPEWRGRGVGRALMEAMITWCREEGFAWVNLHATDAGRPLYDSLGFVPTNEMRLELPAHSTTPAPRSPPRPASTSRAARRRG